MKHKRWVPIMTALFLVGAMIVGAVSFGLLVGWVSEPGNQKAGKNLDGPSSEKKVAKGKEVAK